jgi:hypothetical protein
MSASIAVSLFAAVTLFVDGAAVAPAADGSLKENSVPGAAGTRRNPVGDSREVRA